MIKLEGTVLAPDATGTLRLSFEILLKIYDAKPLVDGGRGGPPRSTSAAKARPLTRSWGRNRPAFRRQ